MLLQGDGHTLELVAQALQGLQRPFPAPRDLSVEGTLLQDIDKTGEVLAVLKGMGVTVAIDDFGTGYSSLAYLKRLPIDKLKIDKSFVQEEVMSPDNEAIINSVIAMSHSMGLEVIAEGVETESVLDFLESGGCDQIQGYWYGRPLSVEQFVTFVTEVLQPDGSMANPAEASSAGDRPSPS